MDGPLPPAVESSGPRSGQWNGKGNEAGVSICVAVGDADIYGLSVRTRKKHVGRDGYVK